MDGSTFYLNVQASILWNAHPYRTHPAFCGGLFEENSVFGNNIGFVLMGSCLAYRSEIQHSRFILLPCLTMGFYPCKLVSWQEYHTDVSKRNTCNQLRMLSRVRELSSSIAVCWSTTTLKPHMVATHHGYGTRSWWRLLWRCINSYNLQVLCKICDPACEEVCCRSRISHGPTRSLTGN